MENCSMKNWCHIVDKCVFYTFSEGNFTVLRTIKIWRYNFIS